MVFGVQSEPVEGELSIRAVKGLRLQRTSGSADTRQDMSAPYRDGRYHVRLERSLATYWLVLK